MPPGVWLFGNVRLRRRLGSSLSWPFTEVAAVWSFETAASVALAALHGGLGGSATLYGAGVPGAAVGSGALDSSDAAEEVGVAEEVLPLWPDA